MKALSVRQPWASLIASGRKTLEVRTWRTAHRGPLLIVASRLPDTSQGARRFQHDPVYGATVCVVDLAGIRRGTRDDEHLALVVTEGRFVWELRNPRAVEAVPVRGRLSIYDVPDSTVVCR